MGGSQERVTSMAIKSFAQFRGLEKSVLCSS